MNREWGEGNLCLLSAHARESCKSEEKGDGAKWRRKGEEEG